MAYTWDTNFKVDPEGGDNPSVGDDEIRAVRGAIEERMVNEHTTFADGTLGNYLLDWNHRAGSAKAYYQSATPTTRPNATTALGTADAGRIWVDSSTNRVYVYSGSAWVAIPTLPLRITVFGGMAVGGAVVPRITFPFAVAITKVNVSLETAPTGAEFRVDLEKNGNSGQSIFGTNDYVAIAAAAYAGSSTDFDGTYSLLSADDYLTVDVDQVGSTVPGSDLVITISYVGR